MRLTTFHWLASTLLSRKLPGFLSSHPGVTVEVNVDDGLRDLVSLGFDAGIRFGESVERDMIAVRIGPSLRMAVVATPEYWNTHGRPRHPRDLLAHPCIAYRNLGNGSLLPWDFEKYGKELRIQVRGPLACNSADLALAAVGQAAVPAGPNRTMWPRTLSPDGWSGCWTTGANPIPAPSCSTRAGDRSPRRCAR